MHSKRHDESKIMPTSDMKNNIQDYFIRLWVLSGVPLALIGNAASDIWLSVTAVFFLLYVFYTKQWFWAKIRWFQAAIALWAWMLIVSALSAWPANSLPESAAWIRFPVFALALPFIFHSFPGLFKQFVWAVILGLLFLILILILEKINNPDAVRLYGTWKQNTKIGWFLTGLGLPASYFLLSTIIDHKKHGLWALPLVSIFVLSVILTGEIYATVSFLFGLCLFIFGLFVFSNRINLKTVIGIIAGIGALISSATVAMLAFRPELAFRFYHSLTTRLPWMPSSDYFIPWMRGLKVGELNPFIGIGPKNYYAYCEKTADILAVGRGVCLPHPHQLYIQIWAEIGFIGLILSLIMIGFMFYKILQNRKLFALPLPVICALCLLITLFWPISTYSHAFGQHKNFFTWLGIAWAFYLAQSIKVYRPQKTDAPSTTNGSHIT